MGLGEFLVGHYYKLRESLEQLYIGTAVLINTTRKKCTGVWSTWGGGAVLPAQIPPPISLPLFIASEYVIFKSACSTMYFTLQCYLSLLQSSSKADAALNEKTCYKRGRVLPGFLQCLCPLGEQLLGGRGEIQLDAASILLDERS